MAAATGVTVNRHYLPGYASGKFVGFDGATVTVTGVGSINEDGLVLTVGTSLGFLVSVGTAPGGSGLDGNQFGLKVLTGSTGAPATSSETITVYYQVWYDN